jgi:hypothetical protein
VKTRTIALLAALAIASGCSGGPNGTSAIPFARPQAARPEAERGKAHLTVRIRIPKRHRSGVHPRYVSAATQGMTLKFVGPSTFTDVVALTPSSPGCSGSPLACTIQIALATGNYVVTIDTYNQAPAGGSIPPTAKLLSTAANVAVSVTTGSANHLSFTLGGVPATISVGPFPSAYVGAGGFLNQSFGVTAKDAAGDTIVGLYDAPIVLTNSDTSGATSIATSGSDKPPSDTLLSSGDPAMLSWTGVAMAPITITATAGSVSANSQFKVHNPYFVADFATSSVKEVPPGCSSSVCVVTLDNGLSGLVGIAADGKANLYVALSTSKEIVRMSPCFSGYCLAAIVADGLTGLKGVAVDRSDTHLYVAAGSSVYELSGSCMTLACSTGVGGGFTNPYQIAVDASGNVFVADPTLGEVFKVPSGCTSVSCTVQLGTTAFTSPYGVAVDSADNVYVADTFGSVFVMASTCTDASCTASVGGGFAQPQTVAVDDFGSFIVGDTVNNTVTYGPPNCTTSFCMVAAGAGYGSPVGVAAP